MQIAYKAVRIHRDGRLTSILAEEGQPCFMNYQRGKIVKSYGNSKLFVYSKKPTSYDIRRISTDENIRVFRCVVDVLEPAQSIPKGWSGLANDTWTFFWSGILQAVSNPLPDTFFCNEVILLNDVTRSIKLGMK